MAYKLLLCFLFLHQITFGDSVPFFGPFRRTTTVPPVQHTPEQRKPRIINADHGGLGAASPTASFAGGNVASAPWIPGTRDQYILDQLVILHPDSPLNRDAWRESGMLNYEYDPHPKIINFENSTPLPVTPHPIKPSSTTPSSYYSSTPPGPRKPHRKSKQQNIQNTEEVSIPKSVNGLPFLGGNSSPNPSSPLPNNNDNNNNNNFLPHATLIPSSGGLFDLHQSPQVFFRDLNPESEDAPVFSPVDPVFLQANSLFYPIATPFFPHQPRATSQPLPPEAVIQLLKSPEQELSPFTKPQVKLPFPLSHDCSSGAGGAGSKPLQFVVLPIVEPVAPLKPLIPRPSFLTSQYGQFPYIPPFNLFKKPPMSSSDSPNGGSSGGSGQFVPILNRPAPPLPFVFVQSLPLELIGQNTEMDVIHAPAPSTNTETKIKDVPNYSSSPISAPLAPLPTPASVAENIQNPTRPLPLIVIEKVKTPGQPPSSPVAPAAAVVEISKQSLQKNSNNQSPPLSTISVVQPITSGPTTLQKQQEIQKAIEKLVPVAAAVLENVEQQQKQQQKEQGKDKVNGEIKSSIPPSSPLVGSNPAQNPPPIVPTGLKVKDQDKTPLRAPLRPESDKRDDSPSFGRIPFKKPDVSSSEEAGIGSTTTLGEVEVTEA